MSNSAQSAWPTQTQSSGSANALAPPPGQQSRPPPNGTPSQSHPSPQAPLDLAPPPQQQQQQQQQGQQSQQAEGPFPTQTVPAEQVLASPADKWGLAAFLHAIRNADEDRGMLAFGTDLMSLGMNMGGVE
jgi:CCR4-NOT transcription complex subunit 2